ncbi:MAG: Holliday junction branch migration protein RuvA [Deltaproteobacteria bacterium]|nr:Holliday junction branch migration protein RuvA [Deltaproteobacteria bacterium]
MISILKGFFHSVQSDTAVFMAGNVGYEVLCTSSLIASIDSNENEREIDVYTHMTDHNVELFAFVDVNEKKLFRKLITVNGIGPKAALSLLSAFGCIELTLHILKGNEKAIVKAPGIGKKTAQRLILELGEFARIFKEELPASGLTGEIKIRASGKDSENLDKTREALTGLGYRAVDIQSIESELVSYEKEGHDISAMVKYSLALLRKEKR